MSPAIGRSPSSAATEPRRSHMSTNTSDALERSVLEGKDREQLLAIAAALGVKASSRTKKADIIDKILEQTGSPAEAAAPEPPSAPTPPPAPSPAVTDASPAPDAPVASAEPASFEAFLEQQDDRSLRDPGPTRN